MTHSPIISDYTLNSKSKNIKYQFADGEYTPGSSSYSEADFLSDNPGKTPEDYAALKKFSDDDYHARKLHDYNTTHLNWNIEWAEQAGLCFAQSPEDILIARINAEEYARKRARQVALAKKALAALSEIQRRRYVRHFAFGVSIREIARREGKDHKTVLESINGAEKKIKKIIAEG
jgi:hypothetical protein